MILIMYRQNYNYYYKQRFYIRIIDKIYRIFIILYKYENTK